MKELSIEEKAKAYDEAYERAKKLKETCDSNAVVGWMEYIFPELKESEDEKIRKEITTYLKSVIANKGYEDKIIESWIAWLERQGEYEKGLLQELDDKLKNTLENETPESLEKFLNEQKPIEPKFHEGDIIKEKETGNLFYVNSIEDFGYTLHYKNCNANGCTMSFKYEDNYELVEQKPTEDVDLPEFESYLCLMFQKFRTKGMCTNGEIIDYVKEHSQKLRDILVNPAWSEGDENVLEDIEEAIINYWHGDTQNILLDWLKSRIPQKQWKPSDEQIEEFRDLLDDINWEGDILVSLYNDLKKLKE